MCGEHERFWWPLDLSERERRAVAEASVMLSTYPQAHDAALNQQAVQLLTEAMSRSLGEIEARDTLPNLCHVINGWGNAALAEGSVLDGYARYVHRSGEGAPHVLQCSEEGDFHPWQSFAYAVMAGVFPDTKIAGAGCTLFDLALGSRFLNTTDGCELGHLLYTAAHFGLDAKTPFAMGERVVDLAQLVELAIEAHHDGHFRVCRKVHLTEGLCAIAALDPAFAEYREEAQGFLDGQLDLLPVLCAAVLGARQARERGEALSEDSVVSSLRKSLAIEGFLENHYYLAGHLIELATLAHGFGYEVRSEHWAAARFVVDELNRLLPHYLPQVFFPACFLHFGHYRRAVTLLDELAAGRSLDPATRARFTADFRRLRAPEAVTQPPLGDGVFAFGRGDLPMRPELERAIRAYGRIASDGLEVRGNGVHFRRVLVLGWPRWLHFEVFDYGAGVVESQHTGLGVELHIENPHEHSLFSQLEHIAGTLRGSPLLASCQLDPSWWGGGGRLWVWFSDETPPETIALALRELIETAKPVLTPELDRRFPVAIGHAS